MVLVKCGDCNGLLAQRRILAVGSRQPCENTSTTATLILSALVIGPRIFDVANKYSVRLFRRIYNAPHRYRMGANSTNRT
jgi:hypothetical protein